MNKQNAINEVIEHGIDRLENGLEGIEVADLHHHLYNEDYFIIGYHKAEEFLNDYGTFDAILTVQEYEQDNFGEVMTDLGDSEKVANMLAYIVGEEVLGNCATVGRNWEKKLTPRMIEKIKSELDAQNKFL